LSKPRRNKNLQTPSGTPSGWRGWAGPAVLLLAALVAAAPLFSRGPSCSGDFNFHFVSWMDAEHSMWMGQLYPHWANSPNFGAGEPGFVFYPPLSWMGGAVLGMLLPWSVVPLAALILLLFATGLGHRALAREAMEDGPATLAGCAAIFLGYALFSAYKRDNFAEMTGGFWIPLLLLFALRRRNPSGSFWRRVCDGSAAPLAFIVAGIWLSNVPLGIMACTLLAAVALVSTLIERSLLPVARAGVSTLGGLGLASVYLLPAVWERNWISVQNALDPVQNVVENGWLFAHHADPLLASHDVTLHQVSVVAVVMLAIALAGGAVAWMRGTLPDERRWILPIALIPPAVLFLLTPLSQPVWNLLPELRLLQFPWRWLVVVEAPMALGFAAAVWFDRKVLRGLVVAACAIAFAAIAFTAPQWWFTACGSTLNSLQESVREGVGVLGKPEHAPPGIRYPVVSLLVDAKGDPLADPLGNMPQNLMDTQTSFQLKPNVQIVPPACLLNDPQGALSAGAAPAWHGDPADCNGTGWNESTLVALVSDQGASRQRPEQKSFSGVAGHAGYLILRLRFFPAWSVKVNGTPVTAVAERERGLMAVPVPQGDVQVSVDWTTTGDVLAGRWLSAISFLLVTALLLTERKPLRERVGVWANALIYRGAPAPAESDPKRSEAPANAQRGNTPSGKTPRSK
jgi:hypothetical protein